MFRSTFTYLQLFAAIQGVDTASSVNSGTHIMTPPALKADPIGFDYSGFLLCLDDSMWEALKEAIIALGMFGIFSVYLRGCRSRTAGQQCTQRAKLAAASPTNASQMKKEQVRPCNGGRFAPSPTAAPRQKKATAIHSETKRRPCCTPVAGKGTDVANRQSLRPARKAPTCGQTDADFLVAAIKAGRASELPSLIDSACNRGIDAANSDVAVAEKAACDLVLVSLRGCAASRCFKHGVAAYHHMAARIGKGSAALWSILLYNMAEAEAFNKYEEVFINLCRLDCLSGHDVVNMVRCCVGKQDLMGLQDMITCLRNSGHFIDTYTLNRSLAVCGNVPSAANLAEELVLSAICTEGLDSVGYNTLMKCNARSGKVAQCFDLRTEMLAKGVELSEVTYGILLDACVGAKEMESARKVFDDLCQSNLRVNVVHCTTFLKGLVSSGQLDEAATVIEQMSQSAGVKPDLITYSTVVRAFAENGNISSAMKMLEHMIQEGVQPDEIIFNSVLSACSAFPLKSVDVLRAFDLLLGHGMVPTTTTLSILVKALMLTEAHTLALQILDDSSVRFNLAPAMRLYVQLIQACIKARRGKAALEVFHAMLRTATGRGEVIEPGSLNRLIRSCVLGGNHQLADEFRLAAQDAGLAIEPQTERMLKAAKAKTSK